MRAIADSMLVRAAKLHIEKSGPKRLIVSEEDFLSNFLKYDDFTFLDELRNSTSERANELVRRLDERKLFKRYYEEDMKRIKGKNYLVWECIRKMKRPDLTALEASIAGRANIEPDFIIVYPSSIENPVYKNPDKYLEGGDTPILIKTKAGGISSFDDISPISGSQEKHVEKLFVFSEPNKKELLQDTIAEEIDKLS